MNLIKKKTETYLNCLRKKDFKITIQRKMVIEVFLQAVPHISVEELYERLKEKNLNIGLATVYRTLKILCDSGLAGKIRLKDGITRYEPIFNIKHHDHLICLKCGRLFETVNPEIQELQTKVGSNEWL